jgi:glycosyltransferase involved in cell wall biosynthesis
MYSLLMSVYGQEKASYLDEALGSIFAAPQRPGLVEIILVWDGPLPEPLMEIIARWEQVLPIRSVRLERNQGLAAALTAGLAHVATPWVMRFDTDDVLRPDRFAVQYALMASDSWDLMGSQISEFAEDSTRPHQSRAVPTGHESILMYSRARNPFNHMTVCYRTELARRLGGYPHLPFMEDYALWVNMLRAGARTMNSPEVLVHARIGAGMYERRGGLAYVRREYQLQRFLYASGHKSATLAVLHGLLRSSVFLSPVRLRRWVYESILRRSSLR